MSAFRGFLRYFLIFSPEDPGFEDDGKPAGHVRVECRDGKGKLFAVAHNLKPGNGRFDYVLYLLRNKNGSVDAVRVGRFEPKAGRVEIEWAFNPYDVGSTGYAIEEFDTAVVLVEYAGRQSTTVICPLAAYKNRRVEWRGVLRPWLVKKSDKTAYETKKAEKLFNLVPPGHVRENISEEGTICEPVRDYAQAGSELPIPETERSNADEIETDGTAVAAGTELEGNTAEQEEDMGELEEACEEAEEDEYLPDSEAREFSAEAVASADMEISLESGIPGETGSAETEPHDKTAVLPSTTGPFDGTDGSAVSGPSAPAGVLPETERDTGNNKPRSPHVQQPDMQGADIRAFRKQEFNPPSEQENGPPGHDEGPVTGGINTGCVYLNGNMCGTVLKNGMGSSGPCGSCRINGKNADAYRYVIGNIDRLQYDLDMCFERSDPFNSRRSDYTWWKVTNPVNLNNILFQNGIKSPLMFNPAVMTAHYKYRHLIIGIFTHRDGKKFVVCGVPGMYMVDRKPFGEFSKWVQADGGRLRYGAFGYWLVYINPKDGKFLEIT